MNNKSMNLYQITMLKAIRTILAILILVFSQDGNASRYIREEVRPFMRELSKLLDTVEEEESDD